MIIASLLSYLVGSMPNAYILVRLIRGIDIREHGSGNVGATNVFRVAGKTLGTVALFLDMMKGFVASFYFAKFTHPPESDLLTAQLLCGIMAIAGHAWPIWLKFKGGKGVATSCGVFLGIAPIAVLCSLVVWIAFAVLTKYVSVSSIAAAVLFPIWILLFYHNSMLVIVTAVLAAFIVFTHRSNLARLRAGNERKIGQKNS